MRNIILPLILLLIIIFFSGCGYTTDRLIREDMGSVYVAFFENDGWRQGLEVDLRRALARELKLHGGVRFADRGEADSIIEGQIKDYSIRSMTTTREDEVLMKRITVGIRYRWLDGLSGRELVPWTEINETVFLPAGHQDSAEAVRAFRPVARRLVQNLERPW